MRSSPETVIPAVWVTRSAPARAAIFVSSTLATSTTEPPAASGPRRPASRPARSVSGSVDNTRQPLPSPRDGGLVCPGATGAHRGHTAGVGGVRRQEGGGVGGNVAGEGRQVAGK